MTKSEEIMSAFSQMYFFKELVIDNLTFRGNDGNNQELADLILNFGDSIIAIQIKEREESAKTANIDIERKWFFDRMKLAKKQIRNTISFIRQGKLPSFRNKQGMDLTVRADTEIVPLVVFVNDAIKDYSHILESHSSDGFAVNCMSINDFQIMCKELIAPVEIVDYLKYRLDFYEKNGPVSLLISDLSEEDVIISRPASNETLVHNYIVTKYGKDALNIGCEVFEHFRWFVQQTSERSLQGKDNYSTYSIILFLAQFSRNEIKAFEERLKLAIITSKRKIIKVVGSISVRDTYTVFFVSLMSEDDKLPMDYLYETARKYNPKRVLQVYIWWLNDIDFRIDYLLLDTT